VISRFKHNQLQFSLVACRQAFYHRKPFYLKLGFLTLKYSGDIFRRETRRREVFIRIRQFEKKRTDKPFQVQLTTLQVMTEVSDSSCFIWRRGIAR
jgi:hypothetical protein